MVNMARLELVKYLIIIIINIITIIIIIIIIISWSYALLLL